MKSKEDFEELPEEAGGSEVKKVTKDKKEKASGFTKYVSAKNFLSEKYQFRRNVITTEVEYRLKTWAKDKWLFWDDYAYQEILDNVLDVGIDIAENRYKTIIEGGLAEAYNPFTLFLDSCGVWDEKTDYISQYLDIIELKDESRREHLKFCWKKWFVALVASLLDDATTNQTCFVMVGGQAVGKSTFFRDLIPKDISLDYYYPGGGFDPDNKDYLMKLGTKMIINLEELATLNKTDVEALKAVITLDRIVLRKAFGRADIKLWRRASFCATTNKDDVIRDTTGSRRFLIFDIKNIQIKKRDVRGLYSQACALYKSGFRFWFDQEEIKQVNESNEVFRDKALVEELITKHFRVPRSGDIIIQSMNSTDIAMYLADKYNRLNINQSVKKEIGAVMHLLGFEKSKKRRNGKVLDLWQLIPVEDRIEDLDAPEGSVDFEPF